MPVDIVTISVGAVGAALGMIARPFFEKIVQNFLNRKPVFAVSPHVLRGSSIIALEPVNSAARRAKPLNLSFRGAIKIAAGELHNENKEILTWTIDLSQMEPLYDELIANSFAEFSLFFDSDHLSEPVRITYKEGPAPSSIEPISQVSVQSIRSFIQSIGSRRIVTANKTELIVCDGFPLTTNFVHWESIFDGKEMHISNVADLEISGDQAAILTNPQYAWVLTFTNCTNLVLDGLTVGHTTSGYCLGGVIKLVNCSGVKIRDCDLYGSGTYGFELENCSDVDVDRTTVRDCSYGILQLKDCSSITFSDCKFADNREFDLCTFRGGMEEVMFRRCSFERNFSQDALFCLKGITRPGSGVFVWDCLFKDNQASMYRDEGSFLSESRNRHVGNSWRANG